MRANLGAQAGRRLAIASGKLVARTMSRTPHSPRTACCSGRDEAHPNASAISAEFLDQKIQSMLGSCSRYTFRLHKDGQSMQRAPQHLCHNYRLWPIWPKRGDQRLERAAKGCRRFLAGELDLRRQNEHRFVYDRLRASKIEIDGTNVAQNVRTASGVAS